MTEVAGNMLYFHTHCRPLVLMLWCPGPTPWVCRTTNGLNMSSLSHISNGLWTFLVPAPGCILWLVNLCFITCNYWLRDWVWKKRIWYLNCLHVCHARKTKARTRRDQFEYACALLDIICFWNTYLWVLAHNKIWL